MKYDELIYEVVVQAHEKRSHFFPYLRKELGEDTEFYIDRGRDGRGGNLGTWGNRKRAYKEAKKNKPWILVIQDDALLCKDFLKKANDFLKKVDKTHKSVQFYNGSIKLSEKQEEEIKEKGYYEDILIWGVAIAIKTELLTDEFYQIGDSYYQDADDTKIQYFLKTKKLLTAYPMPCLVQHRSNKQTNSLVLMFEEERQSKFFIDDIKDLTT